MEKGLRFCIASPPYSLLGCWNNEKFQIIDHFEGDTAKAKQYARENPDTSVYVMRPNEGDKLPHVKVNQNFGLGLIVKLSTINLSHYNS